MSKVLAAIKNDFHKEDFSKLFFLIMTNFLLMLSYSLVRPASSSIFLENVGAKNTPLAWFFSILVLIFTIFIFNKAHFKINVNKRYNYFAVISSVFILLAYSFVEAFPVFFSYALYIVKEIYVVVLFNLFIGYANNIFSLETKKSIYGALGALGSLGATIGGLSVGFFTDKIGIQGAVYFSAVAIVLSAICFQLSGGLKEKNEVKEDKKISPFKAVTDIKAYVFYIALIIILTQFVINIADFKFNHFVGEIFSKEDKAAFFGKVYSSINIMALVAQIFLMPLILNLVKNKNIQIAIPAIHLVTAFLTFVLGSSVLVAASFFALLKAIDYSFFSTSKEILYHKLNSVQQYGAKYISDMVCYRFGKALIAVFLIFIQDIKILNILIVVFLILWLISVVKLFRIQSKLEA